MRKIRISDVTMKQAGAQNALSFKEKIELAKLLDKLGVDLIDLARCDMAEAVESAFRYSRLVLATTTYNGDIFPFMKEFLHHLTERTYRNRTVGLIESGSWAPQAAKIMRNMLAESKDLTFTDTTVKIVCAMNEENKQQIEAMADELTR